MKKAVTLLIAVGAVVSMSVASFATVIHVPADQPTIQAGIDSAQNGDTVLVAPGTYTGNGNRDIDFGGKGFVLKSENDPDSTIIDCEGSASEPHRGFYFHSGEDSTTVVEGFTIRNGYGLTDSPFPSESVGGGIKCDSSSSPKIINNTISGNSGNDGGGIYCDLQSSPTISNNTIAGNSADNSSGGGISCSNSSPMISNNTITGNTTYHSSGGGISCYNSSPTIRNNTITGNSAVFYGGGIYCYYFSSPTISNNTISGNSADRAGGIYCSGYSNATISNNTISGNSAHMYGGGISCYFYSSPTISNNTISGNSANSGGGGISCRGYSNATISNNTISENSVVDYGGGIYCYYYSNPTISNNTISGNSADRAGGIYCRDSSNPTISNNTISGNSASTNGAGLFLKNNSSPSVENCIFAFNSGSEAIWCQDETSIPTLTCCDVYGNEGGDWVGCIDDQAGINGNFSLDPLFCDTATGDYHLSWASPCLAWYNSCCVLIGALDAGCSGGYVCGDANRDSLVNLADVAFLQAYYFECSTPPFPYLASDLNCDGSVDIADIVYLAQFLNGTGPEPCCW